MPQKTFPHLKHNFNFIDEVEKVVTSRLGIGTQLTHCGDDVDGQNGGDGHDGYMAMMVMVIMVTVMMVTVMMVMVIVVMVMMVVVMMVTISDRLLCVTIWRKA